MCTGMTPELMEWNRVKMARELFPTECSVVPKYGPENVVMFLPNNIGFPNVVQYSARDEVWALALPSGKSYIIFNVNHFLHTKFNSNQNPIRPFHGQLVVSRNRIRILQPPRNNFPLDTDPLIVDDDEDELIVCDEEGDFFIDPYTKLRCSKQDAIKLSCNHLISVYYAYLYKDQCPIPGCVSTTDSLFGTNRRRRYY